MDLIKKSINTKVIEKCQISKETLKERFSCLFNNEKLSDIHLFVGKDKHYRIPAHKLVLAASSDVFEEIFFGSSATNSKEIEFPDVEPQAFLAFLEFIYSEEAKIDYETVMSVISVANKYNVPALKKYCVNFVKQNLDCDHAVLLLKQARFCDEPQLAAVCLDFIDKNATIILASDDFIEIDLDILITILERDTLQINESKLYQAVLRWTEAECKRKHLPSTPENQRFVLYRAFTLIRFPLMAIEEFGVGPVQSGLLTDREVRQLILYFTVNPKPSVEFSDVPRVGECVNEVPSVRWIPARNGQVPPNAVQGGYDQGRPLYVARAFHDDIAFIPGKLLPEYGLTYIAWRGSEHSKDEYEVLCGCNFSWVPASGGRVPEGALPGGHTEYGEPLFIGRVAFPDRCLTIGRIHRSRGLLYISFGGRETGFPDYEVLVVQ
ncbi:BTB/POZ domain-containing protein 2-like [Chrysoperla carnea]|uniref:BTB/POZ domain-containing protein 2-like n=1 Tax=Chrysoperla carnea TaxID=189513 RepID=UPI001D05E1BF|nr:BTB/POZ domain-containing protein 2-like [Chrysoperla carnea]